MVSAPAVGVGAGDPLFQQATLRLGPAQFVLHFSRDREKETRGGQISSSPNPGYYHAPLGTPRGGRIRKSDPDASSPRLEFLHLRGAGALLSLTHFEFHFVALGHGVSLRLTVMDE